jgi:hypothetical protein
MITVFVIIWLVVFNYESVRLFYLSPLFHRELPKIKFLFPPAGWVMFYQVGNSYGHAEVYGIKDGRGQLIDPHQVLQTRAIGYDNINRNALVAVLDQRAAQPFCRYLKRKFPYFDSFAVTYVNYPSVIERPFEKNQGLMYECS